jgi:hypothetical protein
MKAMRITCGKLRLYIHTPQASSAKFLAVIVYTVYVLQWGEKEC